MRQKAQLDDRSQEGETDVRQLIFNMWDTRKVVLTAALFVTLGYWGIWGVAQVFFPPMRTYDKIIHLSFAGADINEYPNGTPFMPPTL